MADENLSPLPTKLELIRGEQGDLLVDQNGAVVTDSQDAEWQMAVFAEMVRRYNTHQDLIQGIKSANQFISDNSGGGETDFREALEATLAAAGA